MRFTRAVVNARARANSCSESQHRKEPRDGKGQPGDVVLSARGAAVIKKEIHQRTGGKYQVQRRWSRVGDEEDGAPPPLKYLCRMTSHFWNPAVYYKVLCTGTMTRAQTVTEATVITRKMVVPGVVASIDPRSERHAVKGARLLSRYLPRETSGFIRNYSELRRESVLLPSRVPVISNATRTRTRNTRGEFNPGRFHVITLPSFLEDRRHESMRVK